MSWQEQLRALDEELSLGLISAEEHRLRRESVLSAANPTPATSASGEQTRMIHPPKSEASPDSTQIVPPAFAWQVSPPAPPNEQTQIVAATAMPPNPSGPWRAQSTAEDSTPPWADADFPPPPPRTPDWIREDGEAFDRAGGRAGRRVLTVLGVIVVLAGLGVGVWLLGADHGTEQRTAHTTPLSTTSRARPTAPADVQREMPDVPATQRSGRNLPVAELLDAGIMDQPEVDILRAAGVTEVITKSGTRVAGTDGPTADELSVIVIPTASSAEARRVAEALRAHQETIGLQFIPEPLPNMPATVVFEKKVVAESAVYRGLYVSGDSVLRITATQIPFTDENGLSGSYRGTMETMLAFFPD